ncbi:MAG: aspartyl/asparaginyl beta-hydroxylase domain-containing protein [Alphaproteobacteria bacterium]|nr:aspartyl/asparaginyl beta-hydroxylase domain-containing protein [Alphaproteobacteria bacterium]
MDLGRPFVPYQSVDISELSERLATQPASFWQVDKETRTTLARNRPGNSVFFYNDRPGFASRNILHEALSGIVNVLRYSERGLFEEVDAIIQTSIVPEFPGCMPIRVQLAELGPGQVIRSHTDLGILIKIHRLHVPITTHEDVTFIIQNKRFHFETGHLFELNNTVMHGVENNSDASRIHLLVDMLPTDFAHVKYHDSEEAMRRALA